MEEDGRFAGFGLVGLEELVGLGAETQVGDHDGAAPREQELGDGQVDAGPAASDDGGFAVELVRGHLGPWNVLCSSRVHPLSLPLLLTYTFEEGFDYPTLLYGG